MPGSVQRCQLVLAASGNDSRRFGAGRCPSRSHRTHGTHNASVFPFHTGAIGPSLPSGYEAIVMSNIGQQTGTHARTHTDTHLHTDRLHGAAFALRAGVGVGGVGVVVRRAAVTVRPNSPPALWWQLAWFLLIAR